jgi:ribosomal protein L27
LFALVEGHVKFSKYRKTGLKVNIVPVAEAASA